METSLRTKIFIRLVIQIYSAEQQTAFWNYVESNDYLKSCEGSYAER